MSTVQLCFVSTLPLCSQFSTQLISKTYRKRLKTFVPSPIRCVQVIDKPSQSTVKRSFAKKPSAKPKLTAEGDSLESTPWQWSVLLSFFALSTITTTKIITQISSPFEAITSISALVISYLAADLAIGIYHHAVDNYGSKHTPLVGYQIEAFQGHHDFPWTITNRDIANNLYRLVYPTALQMIPLILFPLPTSMTTFYASFLFFIVLSQETHRQAHLTRAAPWVRTLQSTGIIVSQRMHMAHHRSPFDGNYCILSGVWNKLLDEKLFFRRVEAIVYRLTGVQPICWKLQPELKDQALSL